MNILHKLAELLSHIVGDPVHAQSAGAIQTTLKAIGTAGPDATAADVEAQVDELLKAQRAITPEEWAALEAAAHAHLAAPVPPPTPDGTNSAS